MTPWAKQEPLTEGAEWWERVLVEPALKAVLVRVNPRATWVLGILCGDNIDRMEANKEWPVPHREDRSQMLAHCDIFIAEWLQGLICEVTAPTEVAINPRPQG